MHHSIVLVLSFYTLNLFAAPHAEVKGFGSADDKQARTLTREEVESLGMVKDRVCDLERRIQKHGIMTYSSYSNQAWDNNLPAFQKKEKILKAIADGLDAGKWPAAKQISHLIIDGRVFGQDTNPAIKGVGMDGYLQIGEDANWKDVDAFLKALPDPAKQEKEAEAFLGRQADFVKRTGIAFNGQGSLGEMKGMLDILEKQEAKKAKHWSESEMTSITLQEPSAFLVKGFNAGNVTLALGDSHEEVGKVLDAVPPYKYAAAIEELKGLVAQAKDANLKELLQKTLSEQESKNPKTIREKAAKNANQGYDLYLAQKARQERLRKSLHDTAALAAKFGPQVIITDEYEKGEGKAVLAVLQRLAERGYKLKGSSRTILLTDAYGRGAASQNSGVSGDCMPYSVISGSATEEQILKLFDAPGEVSKVAAPVATAEQIEKAEATPSPRDPVSSTVASPPESPAPASCTDRPARRCLVQPRQPVRRTLKRIFNR